MSSPPFVVAIFIFSRICFVTLTVFILLCLGSFIVVVAVVIPLTLRDQIYPTKLHTSCKSQVFSFFLYCYFLLLPSHSVKMDKNSINVRCDRLSVRRQVCRVEFVIRDVSTRVQQQQQLQYHRESLPIHSFFRCIDKVAPGSSRVRAC